MFISKTKIKFYKKNVFFTANEVWFCCWQSLNIIIYTVHVVEPTLYKSFFLKKPFSTCFFSIAPVWRTKKFYHRTSKHLVALKKGMLIVPLLIDPRKGRAFCKVSIGHIFFFNFYSVKNATKCISGISYV